MSNTELLLENRAMGWVSAATAPAWAQARIIEVRKAQIEKRPTPLLSREYIAAAEKRSMAARNFVRTLFPARRQSLEDRFVAAHGYDPFLMRSRANRQAFEIAREARILAALRRDARPDYLLTADELYHRQMAREYEARAIAQVEVAGCRAKDAEGHRRAAEFHASQARSCRSIDTASLHYAASDAHRRAADNFNDDTDDEASLECLLASNWNDASTGGQQ